MLLQQGKYRPVQDPDAEERRQRPARVVLHNDPVTPAAYVVGVLERVFGFGWWKANWIMTRAHVTGQAPVGVYPRAEAEAKVAAAHDVARSDGWPLRFSVDE